MKQCFGMADIGLDAELRAMQDIATILHQLDPPARTRVLHWIAARFQADAAVAANGNTSVQAASGAHDDSLSVAMLGDLFAPDWADTKTPSDQPQTDRTGGIAAEDLSEFRPILPKPILT